MEDRKAAFRFPCVNHDPVLTVVMRAYWLLSNYLPDFIAGFQSPASWRTRTHVTYWSSINDQLGKPFVQLEQKVPSKPSLAYLAVWLEVSAGNGYACIIDQEQVFKHLSLMCVRQLGHSGFH